MCRICISFFIWLLLLHLGSAGELLCQDNSFSFSDSAIVNRLKTDISILASDSFMGREAGTRGDSLSSAYIISRFREIGLEPKGGDSGSYRQHVPYESSNHPWEENFLRTGYFNYRYRKDFGMTSLSANGKIDGEIFVAGHGIVDPILHRNDYEGKKKPLDCVVLIEFPLPENLTVDTSLLQKFSIRNRVSEAFFRGASAVILWNSDCPDYPALFDFDHPDTMPGPVIFVTETVARQLSSLEGESVSLMATLTRVHHDYQNLVGFVNNGSSRTVIIGAHYDHVGINRNSQPKTGADDNASGVALMIELARYVKHLGDSLFNFLFIAFGAEELGMIGSGYFCAHPVIPLGDISFMCNFDMVGRLGAEGNRVTVMGTNTSPQWETVYESMSKFPFRIKKYKGASSFSDQECFYSRNIPIFYMTTGLHPDYHTHRDRPERINYTGMVPIARFAEEFISRATKLDLIGFQKVSGRETFFADLDYYFKQIGHMFDMPLQDWP